jgi:hypothetical protein
MTIRSECSEPFRTGAERAKRGGVFRVPNPLVKHWRNSLRWQVAF